MSQLDPAHGILLLLCAALVAVLYWLDTRG